MVDEFQEPLKKRVGGSLSKLPPLQRLEMLRRNAWMIRQNPGPRLPMMEPSFEKLLVLLAEAGASSGRDGISLIPRSPLRARRIFIPR